MTTFFLMSDSHLKNNSQELITFKQTLIALKKLNTQAELIHLGDLIDTGDLELLNKVIGIFQETHWDHPLGIPGNHDFIYPEEIPKEAFFSEKLYHVDSIVQKTFHHFFSPVKLPYFSLETDDCFLFFLSTEAKVKDSCGSYLSFQQLWWLEKNLAKFAAEKENKPIFIFSHQALNDTHEHSTDYGGFGSEDQEVKRILQKYSFSLRIIFASGHLHNLSSGLKNSEYGLLWDVAPYCLSRQKAVDKKQVSGVVYEVTVTEEKISFTPYQLNEQVMGPLKSLEFTYFLTMN